MAKLRRAKDIHAYNRTRREEKPLDHEPVDSIDEVQEINNVNPILDLVRPEVREEALRLQRRLEQLVAEGNAHRKRSGGASIADNEDAYNDNAPFPFDVRVNNKSVEVLAPVEHKVNGKKYQAARKSAARWQPLPPRQIAQLNQENTPSIRKANQEYQRHLAHPTPAPRLRPKTGPIVPAPGLHSGKSQPKALPQRLNRPKALAKSQSKTTLGRQQKQTRAADVHRGGARDRKDKGGLFVPSLEGGDEDGNSEESDVPVARRRRGLRPKPRRLLFDNGDSDNWDGESGDDGDDDAIDDDPIDTPARRRARNRKAKEPIQSIAELVAEFEATRGGIKRKYSPVLFPASQPPPKLFVSTKDLREGYQVVAGEEEKVHATFDPGKTHPIDRHLRTINKTTGTPKIEKQKPLEQRVKPHSAIPEPPRVPEAVEFQLPDVIQGEEAYRGRVFQTVERDRELERNEDVDSLFGDYGVQDDDSDPMIPDPPATPEPKKSWRECLLPMYLEEAERDPYAAFH